MSRRRAGVALAIATILVAALLLTLVPMHITLGAGSLRCGTVLSPDTTSEVGKVCPDARPTYLTAVAGVTGALLLLVLGALAVQRVWVRSVLVATWVTAALISTAWVAAVLEYAPPHQIFDL